MDIDALLQALGYLGNRHWVTSGNADPRLAHYYRLAQRAGEEVGTGARVVGSYVYQTSLDNTLLPPRPAVFVAYAENDGQAREIHRSFWNLGDCPFVIIVLPNVVRVYTGFNYSSQDQQRMPIAEEPSLFPNILPSSLASFDAAAIDSGRIWKEQAKYLGTETRVDYRLLTSLKGLSRLLQKNYRVTRKVAHALIGKYIYFRYLRDRKILDDNWLTEHKIQPDDVFGRAATAQGLESLATALQDRFNGDIFPLPVDDDKSWRDTDAVTFIANVFAGDTPDGQLAFDFGVYNFSYIPVELLSAVYEQFLKDEGAETTGVVYTPEALADYVLAELESVHPLCLNHKILDPCCGSGVFLVLAYRRLIEQMERTSGHRPSAEEMKRLLLENIFGVEKDAEACQITAFSLILTLLSYLEPPELHANAEFQFPSLVGENIFHDDFFNDECAIFRNEHRFGWVVGNPPWTKADKKNLAHRVAINWMSEAIKKGYRVGSLRLDEAFTWRVGDVLKQDGYVGLLVNATTLVNSNSSEYRKQFFKKHDVRRITNFSNLRRILFMGPEGKRAEAPAACLIYRNGLEEAKKPILHFGPFVANQIPIRAKREKKSLWTITLFESDIQQIDYADAEQDVPCLWKTALWGGFQDRRALRRLSRILPRTITDIAKQHNWLICAGANIKGVYGRLDGYVAASELVGQRIIETKLLKTKFIVPEDALPVLEAERQFVRKRSGLLGLQLVHAPHILVSAELAIFCDRNFAIPSPKIGIAARGEDAEHLKATAFFLNSSIARYGHFFNNPWWGTYIATATPETIGAIPFIDLSTQQIRRMAAAYDSLAERERLYYAENTPLVGPMLDARDEVDAVVEEVLSIPNDVSTTARDFMSVQFQLIEGKTGVSASKLPSIPELEKYAKQLRLVIDDFAQRRHQITIHSNSEAIIATVEVTSEPDVLPVRVLAKRDTVAQAVLRAVQEQHSQWAYIQRSVRIFDGKCVHIVKAARLLDWTQTQAVQDAADLIADVLSRNSSK